MMLESWHVATAGAIQGAHNRRLLWSRPGFWQPAWNIGAAFTLSYARALWVRCVTVFYASIPKW